MNAAPDPYRYRAERHSEVRVFIRPMTVHWGETRWDANRLPSIWLAVDLNRTERRCTLAHELGHVEKGAPCRSLCPGDEADVREWTARFLLPDLTALGRALVDSDLAGAAEKLDVIPSIIIDRLDSLTAPELADITAVMGDPVDDGTLSAACSDPFTIRHALPPRLLPCGRKKTS